MSGISHQIDFLLPKYKEIPDRILIAVNDLTPQRAKLETFKFQDISRGSEEKYEQLVLFNDTKPISNEISTMFKAYNIWAIPWSKRDNDEYKYKLA